MVFDIMNGRTRQEVFDFVVDNLFKQGRPSIQEDDCLYRGPNNIKCGIGFLIPDSIYNEQFEGYGVLDLKDYDLISMDVMEERFLSDVQISLHDEFRLRLNKKEGFRRWLKRQAKHFAIKYELKFNFNHVRV